MAMERWDPFSDLMSRMMGDWYFRPWRMTREVGGYSLPLDVCETDDEFIIRAAAPGMRPEDLDVSVKEDTLTIRGEMKSPEWMQVEQTQAGRQASPQGQTTGQPRQQLRGQGTHCWVQEIPYGRFTRSITLPSPVNGSNARAEYDNGMLILHLPKAEEAKPRRIEIRGGAGRQLGQGPGQR